MNRNIFGMIFLTLFQFMSISCSSSTPPIKADDKENEDNTEESVNDGPFTTWESMQRHKACPDWLADAKFGIYFHWGVYTVAAYGSEWYPRMIYFPGSNENKYHTSHYGPLGTFDYHDYIPMFKAEYFDASSWAKLFKDSGAKFAGPVAEHHDGFSMWASKVTPWNAKDMGPHKDIVGMLSKSIKSEGLKFITTFHHARNLQVYADSYEKEWAKPENERFILSHYPYRPDFVTASNDPKLQKLYGNVLKDKWLKEIWFPKLKEVIDSYSPDIIWFDSWLDNNIPEDYRLKFCDYYLNSAYKNKQDVAIVRKQDDLPISMSIEDMEMSRKNKINDKPWFVDQTIGKGSWSYTNGISITPANKLIHTLVDIVSKNGILLLNISPRADGIIPEDQRTVLLDMGKWLKTYGEAIYGTKPFQTYGEGPTIQPDGGFENADEFSKIEYTSKDIRYTTKDGNLYVIILGKPETNDITLTALKSSAYPKVADIKNISLLDNSEKAAWQVTPDGLTIRVSSGFDNEIANVLKVEF